MSETPTHRSSWRIVPLLMGISFFAHFNRVNISVAGSEHLIPELGISPERMGMVYTAFLIGYTVFQIPGGVFADRFGVWITLGLIASASAAFTALTGGLGMAIASAGELWVALLIIRSLMGSCNAPLHPSTTRTVSRWIATSSQGLANGLVLGAAIIGVASTYIIFGRLSDRFGWPMAFVVSGALMATVAVGWWLLAGDSPAERRVRTSPGGGPSWGSLMRLLRNRDLIRVTIAYGALDYFEFLFFYWMQYYFGDVLKLGVDTSRLYSTIAMLSMAVGLTSGGWLMDRCVRLMGRRKGRAFVPVVGMSLGAILLVVGVLTKDPRWVVVWFSLALASAVAAEVPSWITAVDFGGEQGATAAGVLNTGGNFGGAIAPVVTPWVGTHFGWQWAVCLGAGISLAGAILWLGVRQAPESS
jgi:MFS transporter, ACS family, D-galactonate transporter